MDIVLFDKYRITNIDERNIGLFRFVPKKNKATGEIVEAWDKNPYGYYSTVESALNAIVTHNLVNSEAKRISDLCEQITKLRKEIRKVIH